MTELSELEVERGSTAGQNRSSTQWTPPDWPGLSQQDREAYERSCGTAEPYGLPPEGMPTPAGLRGTLETYQMADSTVYPGVAHDVQVYVPPPRDQSNDNLALVVFLDGGIYLAPGVGAAAVLDNLISAGQIPPTLGVFVDPGKNGPGLPIYGGTDNRSIEYDSIGDRFSTFLHDEVLVPLAARFPVTIDPRQRTICGLSSGGSAAFTVAWERPDLFGNVISHCGSFVNIRGAGTYPDLIRREPAKPITVLMQTGLRDLDVVFGDWLLANRQMASALAYSGYDHELVVGEGGHSPAHGAQMLPDSLRRLSRRYAGEAVVDKGGQRLSEG